LGVPSVTDLPAENLVEDRWAVGLNLLVEMVLELPVALGERGLSARPLTLADAEAVFGVAAAQERQDLGRAEIELADIIGEWQRPSFEVSRSTVGVYDGDRLVAYGVKTAPDRGEAAVHPDYRGLGIGTALAGWMQALTKAQGSSCYGSAVPAGSPGDRLLEALGYHVRWTSWVLRLPEHRQVPARELPPGYLLREATADDYESVWTVVDDAFLEWSVRDREPYDDFLASTVRRPGFEPWHVRVITDSSGAVVGSALLIMAGEPVEEVYVDRLAVRRDQRHRGLAQALLEDAFAQGRAHGAPRCGLSTDSRTGALGLYLKVGMEIIDTWVNRAVDV
jgi:mycothiol synthase